MKISQSKTDEQVEEIIECDDTSSTKKIDESSIHCPYCGSSNVYGISRVVGYFSIIENWNNSKKSELKRRQKGNYWFKEE
ncbi:MAG: anaerobic ribonucleoside-triphosphate reductase [Candidatus Thorarchaeota archaeon]